MDEISMKKASKATGKIWVSNNPLAAISLSLGSSEYMANKVSMGPALCVLCHGRSCQGSGELECEKCAKFTRKSMKEAWRVFRELRGRYEPCCSAVTTDLLDGEVAESSALMFHSSGWSGEGFFYGVSLHHGWAETYFVLKNRDGEFSLPYGHLLAYEDPDFWFKLDAQVADAVVHVAGNGVLWDGEVLGGEMFSSGKNNVMDMLQQWFSFKG